MTNSLKFILVTQLKRSGINQKLSGFTLIELLVGMILAVLVIGPLMAFMINVLDSDRKEQAKVTTEQEIQAALDYIARDLQQAVYIYDSDGLTRNQTNTDKTLWGIKDEIPPQTTAPNCNNASNCQPVLVFWKREFISNSIGVSSPTDTTTDDGFAYSLVAYYLITNPSSNSTWSPAARIGRFQIRGKVNAANANDTGTACDVGFNSPKIDQTVTGASLKDKMNQWKNSLNTSTAIDPPCSSDSSTYTQRVETLVDYISTSGPSVTCSSGEQGIGTSSFYACVNADKVLAQVYLRGNAFVRLNNNNNIQYSNSVSSYFPRGSIQVQGRGFLFTK